MLENNEIGLLRMKILDAQKFLIRQEANIDPVVYVELMHILERPTVGRSIEELEAICEQHR